MTTYATHDQLIAYNATFSGTDPAVLDALIESAEFDLDSRVLVALAWPDPALASGRKLDLTKLKVHEVTGLMRATCAQAEYRDFMGPEFFIKPQFASVSGPDFNTTGKLPYIGPKVRIELRALSQQIPTGVRATTGGRSVGPIGTGGTPLPWPYDGTSGWGRGN